MTKLKSITLRRFIPAGNAAGTLLKLLYACVCYGVYGLFVESESCVKRIDVRITNWTNIDSRDIIYVACLLYIERHILCIIAREWGLTIALHKS